MINIKMNWLFLISGALRKTVPRWLRKLTWIGKRKGNEVLYGFDYDKQKLYDCYYQPCRTPNPATSRVITKYSFAFRCQTTFPGRHHSHSHSPPTTTTTTSGPNYKNQGLYMLCSQRWWLNILFTYILKRLYFSKENHNMLFVKFLPIFLDLFCNFTVFFTYFFILWIYLKVFDNQIILLWGVQAYLYVSLQNNVYLNEMTLETTFKSFTKPLQYFIFRMRNKSIESRI